MRTHRPLLALSGLTLLSASGCGMGLPNPELVVFTRPLAMRVEVIESVIVDPPNAQPRAQALPFDRVSLQPFLGGVNGPVDPASLDAVYLACPRTSSQGTFGCYDEQIPLRLDELPACDTPSLTGFDFENIPPPQGPCLVDRGVSVAEYVVPFDTNLLSGGNPEILMIAGVEGGPDTDACAERLLVDRSVDDERCIFQTQSVTVGPFEQLAVLAEDLGVELPFDVPEDPSEIPDFDRHPRITRFAYAPIDERLGDPTGDFTDIPLGATIQIDPDARIRIETSSPEEDLQTFPIVTGDNSLQLDDELYFGSWLRTWGSTLSGTSDNPDSFNEYALTPTSDDEEDVPPNGRSTVYYVLQDSRAGVNWWWFQVEATAP